MWAHDYTHYDGFDLLALCPVSGSRAILLIDASTLVVIQRIQLPAGVGIVQRLVWEPKHVFEGAGGGMLACVTYSEGRSPVIVVFEPVLSSSYSEGKGVRRRWSRSTMITTALSSDDLVPPILSWSADGRLALAGLTKVQLWRIMDPTDRSVKDPPALEWEQSLTLQGVMSAAGGQPMPPRAFGQTIALALCARGRFLASSHSGSRQLILWPEEVHDGVASRAPVHLTHEHLVVQLAWSRGVRDTYDTLFTLDGMGVGRLWVAHAPRAGAARGSFGADCPMQLAALVEPDPAFTSSASASPLFTASFMSREYYGSRARELVHADGLGTAPDMPLTPRRSGREGEPGVPSGMGGTGSWLVGCTKDGALRIWRVRATPFPDGSTTPEPREAASLPLACLAPNGDDTRRSIAVSGTVYYQGGEGGRGHACEVQIVVLSEKGSVTGPRMSVVTSRLQKDELKGTYEFFNVRVACIPLPLGSGLSRIPRAAIVPHPYLPLVAQLDRECIKVETCASDVMSAAMGGSGEGLCIPLALPSAASAAASTVSLARAGWLTDWSGSEPHSPTLLLIYVDGTIRALELTEVPRRTLSHLPSLPSMDESSNWSTGWPPMQVPKARRKLQEVAPGIVRVESVTRGRSSSPPSDLDTDHEVGIGLRLDSGVGLGITLEFENKSVNIAGFTRHPGTGAMLPAEESGMLQVGDQLVSVDGISLERTTPVAAAEAIASARMCGKEYVQICVRRRGRHSLPRLGSKSMSRAGSSSSVRSEGMRGGSPPPVGRWFSGADRPMSSRIKIDASGSHTPATDAGRGVGLDWREISEVNSTMAMPNPSSLAVLPLSAHWAWKGCRQGALLIHFGVEKVVAHLVLLKKDHCTGNLTLDAQELAELPLLTPDSPKSLSSGVTPGSGGASCSGSSSVVGVSDDGWVRKWSVHLPSSCRRAELTSVKLCKLAMSADEAFPLWNSESLLIAAAEPALVAAWANGVLEIWMGQGSFEPCPVWRMSAKLHSKEVLSISSLEWIPMAGMEASSSTRWTHLLAAVVSDAEGIIIFAPDGAVVSSLPNPSMFLTCPSMGLVRFCRASHSPAHPLPPSPGQQDWHPASLLALWCAADGGWLEGQARVTNMLAWLAEQEELQTQSPRLCPGVVPLSVVAAVKSTASLRAEGAGAKLKILTAALESACSSEPSGWLAGLTVPDLRGLWAVAVYVEQNFSLPDDILRGREDGKSQWLFGFFSLSLNLFQSLRQHSSVDAQLATSSTLALLLAPPATQQAALGVLKGADWRLLRAARVSMWLRDAKGLSALAESVAAVEYRSTKDIMGICACLYAALGKFTTLRNLAKADKGAHNHGGPSSGERLVALMGHDMSSAEGRKVAEKNAYALLRKHRFYAATAVFLLADPPLLREALQVTIMHLHDMELALLLARIVDSRSGSTSPGEGTQRLLREEIIRKSESDGQACMEAAGLVWLNEPERAVRLLEMGPPMGTCGSADPVEVVNERLDAAAWPGLAHIIRNSDDGECCSSARLLCSERLLRMGLEVSALAVAADKGPRLAVAATKSPPEASLDIFAGFDAPADKGPRLAVAATKSPSETSMDIFAGFDAPPQRSRPAAEGAPAVTAAAQGGGGIFASFNAAPQPPRMNPGHEGGVDIFAGFDAAPQPSRKGVDGFDITLAATESSTECKQPRIHNFLYPTATSWETFDLRIASSLIGDPKASHVHLWQEDIFQRAGGARLSREVRNLFGGIIGAAPPPHELHDLVSALAKSRISSQLPTIASALAGAFGQACGCDGSGNALLLAACAGECWGGGMAADLPLLCTLLEAAGRPDASGSATCLLARRLLHCCTAHDTKSKGKLRLIRTAGFALEQCSALRSAGQLLLTSRGQLEAAIGSRASHMLQPRNHELVSMMLSYPIGLPFFTTLEWVGAEMEAHVWEPQEQQVVMEEGALEFEWMGKVATALYQSDVNGKQSAELKLKDQPIGACLLRDGRRLEGDDDELKVTLSLVALEPPSPGRRIIKHVTLRGRSVGPNGAMKFCTGRLGPCERMEYLLQRISDALPWGLAIPESGSRATASLAGEANHSDSPNASLLQAFKDRGGALAPLGERKHSESGQGCWTYADKLLCALDSIWIRQLHKQFCDAVALLLDASDFDARAPLALRASGGVSFATQEAVLRGLEHYDGPAPTGRLLTSRETGHSLQFYSAPLHSLYIWAQTLDRVFTAASLSPQPSLLVEDHLVCLDLRSEVLKGGARGEMAKVNRGGRLLRELCFSGSSIRMALENRGMPEDMELLRSRLALRPAPPPISHHNHPHALTRRKSSEVHFTIVNRWEVEPLHGGGGGGGVLRQGSLGRAVYAPAPADDASSTLTAPADELRATVSPAAADLWLKLSGGRWIARTPTRSPLPYIPRRYCQTGVTAYLSCLFDYMFRNSVLWRLKLPHRYLPLVRVEMIDLKNLLPHYHPSPMDVYAVLKLGAAADDDSLIAQRHRYNFPDCQVTDVKRVVPSGEAQAGRQWSGAAVFRFALPEDAAPAISADGPLAFSLLSMPALVQAGNSMPDAPPQTLQIAVFKRQLLGDQCIGTVVLPLDELGEDQGLDEWLPLHSHSEGKGVAWFLNVRVSLRFAVMRLDESQLHMDEVHPDHDEHDTAHTFLALADGEALDLI